MEDLVRTIIEKKINEFREKIQEGSIKQHDPEQANKNQTGHKNVPEVLNPKTKEVNYINEDHLENSGDKINFISQQKGIPVESLSTFSPAEIDALYGAVEAGVGQQTQQPNTTNPDDYYDYAREAEMQGGSNLEGLALEEMNIGEVSTTTAMKAADTSLDKYNNTQDELLFQKYRRQHEKFSRYADDELKKYIDKLGLTYYYYNNEVEYINAEYNFRLLVWFDTYTFNDFDIKRLPEEMQNKLRRLISLTQKTLKNLYDSKTTNDQESDVNPIYESIMRDENKANNLIKLLVKENILIDQKSILQEMMKNEKMRKKIYECIASRFSSEEIKEEKEDKGGLNRDETIEKEYANAMKEKESGGQLKLKKEKIKTSWDEVNAGKKSREDHIKYVKSLNEEYKELDEAQHQQLKAGSDNGNISEGAEEDVEAKKYYDEYRDKSHGSLKGFKDPAHAHVGFDVGEFEKAAEHTPTAQKHAEKKRERLQAKVDASLDEAQHQQLRAGTGESELQLRAGALGKIYENIDDEDRLLIETLLDLDIDDLAPMDYEIISEKTNLEIEDVKNIIFEAANYPLKGNSVDDENERNANKENAMMTKDADLSQKTQQTKEFEVKKEKSTNTDPNRSMGNVATNTLRNQELAATGDPLKSKEKKANVGGSDPYGSDGKITDAGKKEFERGQKQKQIKNEMPPVKIEKEKEEKSQIAESLERIKDMYKFNSNEKIKVDKKIKERLDEDFKDGIKKMKKLLNG